MYKTKIDLAEKTRRNIVAILNDRLAEAIDLQSQVKQAHWNVKGPHFIALHELFDKISDAVLEQIDEIAERVRKIGGVTIRSIGHIARLQRIADNDADYVEPADMLSELKEDEKALDLRMRAVHSLCDDADDVATASLLENWIDQTQRRAWFLFETTRR